MAVVVGTVGCINRVPRVWYARADGKITRSCSYWTGGPLSFTQDCLALLPEIHGCTTSLVAVISSERVVALHLAHIRMDSWRRDYIRVEYSDLIGHPKSPPQRCWASCGFSFSTTELLSSYSVLEVCRPVVVEEPIGSLDFRPAMLPEEKRILDAAGGQAGGARLLRSTVELPLWPTFVLLACYPTIAFIRGPVRRWHRRRRGMCAQCGYNLTGNVSGICPECGSPVQAFRAPEHSADVPG
jgi:hypothetical protein